MQCRLILLGVVRYDRKAGERRLDLLRRGLIRYWAKDINVGFAAEGTVAWSRSPLAEFK
jgi:hypothetical protein